MCGIAGAITTERIPDGAIERATSALEHRGPDDEGVERIRIAGGEVVLGNRRLSILDLTSAGHMPMKDPDSGNWITYNGEIFNFHEVRSELQSVGTKFKGDSDTEVILKAYARWGIDCLQKLRGMFAIALFDARKRQLILVRDRLGIKPLYYAQKNGILLFASEVRAILKTGLVRPDISPTGIFQFLTFGSLYDPETIVEDVWSLLPGHYLTWQDGHSEIKQYWDLASHVNTGQRFDLNQPQMLKNVESLLEESVSLHTVSDVPLSVFLSGGIDSCALAVCLERMGKSDINSFSIVFKEAGFSEAEYSRLIAAQIKTTHHEIVVSQDDAIHAIPSAIKAMDQPSFDGVNSYILARAVSDAGLKVALSGLGGDEVFAGYSSFVVAPKLQTAQRLTAMLPGFLNPALNSAISLFVRNKDQYRKLMALLGQGNRHLHPYTMLRMLFVPELSGKLSVFHDEVVINRAFAPVENAIAESSDMDLINQISYLELTNYMRNTLLRDVDAMSMASSLEVRVPFIDHRLIEYVFQLPGSVKMDPHVPKTLLSSALQQVLPEKIVFRRKHGFVLPFDDWFHADLQDTLQRSLCADSTLNFYLDGPSVANVWKSFLAGQTSWTRPWSLYVIKEWFRYNLS